MPVIANLVRRYAVAAVVLPLAAKGLGAAGRRLEASRGPGLLPRILQGGGRLAEKQRGRGRGHR